MSLSTVVQITFQEVSANESENLDKKFFSKSRFLKSIFIELIFFASGNNIFSLDITIDESRAVSA